VNASGKSDDDALATGWMRRPPNHPSRLGECALLHRLRAENPARCLAGRCRAGMCIDFYGRFQSESVKIGDFPSRPQYFTPAGGSSVGVDPIGMLRGARTAPQQRNSSRSSCLRRAKKSGTSRSARPADQPNMRSGGSRFSRPLLPRIRRLPFRSGCPTVRGGQALSLPRRLDSARLPRHGVHHPGHLPRSPP
jgi:hypothetical protein